MRRISVVMGYSFGGVPDRVRGSLFPQKNIAVPFTVIDEKTKTGYTYRYETGTLIVFQGTMKQTLLFAAIVCGIFVGTLSAQETEAESVPENPALIVDADNPGIGLLDQATEAKLRANTILDLSQVIVLCQRAKRAGLTGENLKYCNQLLASSQLQRGLFFAQPLVGRPDARPNDWETIRQNALGDLEEAVTVIKDQPTAHLRIAQLYLLPEGNENKAKEALKLAVESAKLDPEIQIPAIRLLATLEPDPEKREIILAAAARDGEPQIVLFHVAALIELNRKDEALNELKKLLETKSDDVELHDIIIGLLTGSREHKLAMEVLTLLREKATEQQKERIDLQRAELLAKMDQYEEALKLLDHLLEKSQENKGMIVLTWILRSTIHFAMDDLGRALKDIEEAEKVEPDFSPVLEQKYRILVEQENFNDALEVVKKLQTIETDVLHHFLWEVHVLAELKKYDDALKIIQNLREKHPNQELLWMVTLIELYSKQKDYEKVLALVEEQLKNEPNDLRWIAQKTKVLSDQKKWDEAVNWLESYLQKEPDSREINVLLISVLADKKNHRAAKERIKPLLEKTPDDLSLLRMDSQLSISLGHHAEAIKALTKVVESDPEDYTSLNNLAWILCTSPIDSVRNGRRAVELAEQAGKLSRFKRAFVLSTLAAAYAEAGDFEKAKEWSLKSVEIAKKERDKTDEERQELLEHLQKEWDCFNKNEPFRELMEEEQ